jgi:Zn-dependent protease with chaperone function
LAYTRACRNLVGVCLPFLFACAAFGQEESGDSTAAPSKLEINIDAHGGATVHVKIFEPQMPAPLAPAIEHLVGCAFDNPKDREVEGDWIFSGRCAGAFRKRGLLVGGQLQFAPLMEVLKLAKVERLEVTVRHPRSGFSRFLDSGWTIETTAQSVEYTKTLTPASPVPPVRLAFGYRLINFLPISLLLFPVGLSLIMRWAALRARQTDPVVVWFTYWSLFGWMVTGVWLLWIEGSTVLDCAALARFLLNDSPYAPLLQLTFYLVPPILAQLVCTVASGAVLARVSGEHWMLPVSLKHAFWHEPVTIWPILCLWAGVASLALFNEVALGVACLAIAYAAHVVLVRLWLRLQKLSRYELPPGDLRSRILELAVKAGVTLKEIYLLPAAEGRLSGPYMIRRRRLLLSDALLRALRKNETEAVLARELVHLRRHHRAILLGIAVVSLPLIYRFSHLALVEGRVPWALRGPLLVWITPVLLYLLWRRFERTADAEAVELTGDGEALANALPKIAQLNVIGLYWRRLEQRFFPNGSAGDLQQPPEVFPAREEGALVGANAGDTKGLVSGD